MSRSAVDGIIPENTRFEPVRDHGEAFAPIALPIAAAYRAIAKLMPLMITDEPSRPIVEDAFIFTQLFALAESIACIEEERQSDVIDGVSAKLRAMVSTARMAQAMS